MSQESAPAPRRRYRPAITPGLKKLFVAVAVGVAVLGANSLYLSAITFLEFAREEVYQNLFYQYMFLMHLVLGLLLVPPFLIFGALHIRNTWNRKNRKAVRLGYLLFTLCLGVIVTGVVMTVRVLPLESFGGRATYWLHVLLPVFAVLAYVAHRMYGPPIKWKLGVGYGVSVVAVVGLMALLHGQDPRQWNVRGGGDAYFHPSEARTATNGFIPERALMMEHYCQECHPDTAEAHLHSVHKFSSFNNPVYLFSVRESREAMLARDGNVQGARFCAGCHDPVPFFSGAFDDPAYDDVHDPTSQAGITCTVCHAITDVHSTIGNANYTIEEPLHYPFAYSENPLLKWVNRQLVKAKPAFHKKTFLKPLHQTGEFCATCHKVSLPFELNHYKEWLRGQNHWDNARESGVMGGGARSFYYPPVAEKNCNGCHMPDMASEDFGNRDGVVSHHGFPGSNTAIPHLLGFDAAAKFQADFLRDGQMDVEFFALREGGSIEGDLLAPLRPELPVLEPGKSYLLDVVLRTLKLGHVFTQGTSDSNEVWVEVEARLGDRIVGSSGAIDEEGFVDPWSHFVNTYMLDRHGNRIDRRNAQDIFTPLYSHQMPPGTGQVVHYRLDLPEDLEGELELRVRLRYRKFDRTLMNYVYDDLRERGVHEGPTPEIPIVDMAEDRLVLRVGEGAAPTASAAPRKPLWQRWRDYGIGLLLKGNAGSDKGELRQAEQAFRQVVELGRSEGWVDLARVYEKEGRVEEARQALANAIEAGVETTWTVNWLSGMIDKQNGFLDRAIESLETVVSTKIAERNMDFSRDTVVGIELAETLLLKAQTVQGEEREAWLRRAVERLEAVLALDEESLDAHWILMKCHRLLGNREKAEEHQRLHAKYKPDDNARDEAVARARAANPAADRAANAIVIYELSRALR